MITGGFVSYLRVSTARQGRSGLGLEAQREAVACFVGPEATNIGEVIEIESGRKSDRPSLAKALKLARLHRVPLVVAKVDRLTRSVAFLSRLLEAGVDVRFCDLPQIEGPTGRFLLQQMASVAELEAGMISSRTKAALAAAKARGVALGGDRGYTISAKAAAMGRAALSERSAARAADVAETIAEIRAEGVTGLRAIARALTERGVPTARGGAAWTPSGVSRVLEAPAVRL